MATISVLVDTDIFIDYFNSGRFSAIFDSSRFTVDYSVVTKKELLSKPGLRDAERQAILAELGRCRIIKLTETITVQYTELRGLPFACEGRCAHRRQRSDKEYAVDYTEQETFSGCQRAYHSR